MTAASRRRRVRLAAVRGGGGGLMITAMMGLVRGTPLVRGVASAIAAILALYGIVPLVAYPLLRLDAASYESAIGSAARECPGDPIPARGGCWSAAPARVTVTGVDQQSGAAFLVVDVRGQPATREDFVTTPAPGIAVGTTLTARYWHDTMATLLLASQDRAKPPAVLPTRDNPSYRAESFPASGAVLVLLGAAGLLVWGRPLLDDLRRLRERRRLAVAADIAARESTNGATFGRGLARYGIDLQGAAPSAAPEDVVLTGRRATEEAAPAPATPTQSGGKGWSVRPQ